MVDPNIGNCNDKDPNQQGTGGLASWIHVGFAKETDKSQFAVEPEYRRWLFDKERGTVSEGPIRVGSSVFCINECKSFQ